MAGGGGGSQWDRIQPPSRRGVVMQVRPPPPRTPDPQTSTVGNSSLLRTLIDANSVPCGRGCVRVQTNFQWASAKPLAGVTCVAGGGHGPRHTLRACAGLGRGDTPRATGVVGSGGRDRMGRAPFRCSGSGHWDPLSPTPRCCPSPATCQSSVAPRHQRSVPLPPPGHSQRGC